jgi:threonine dehydratase
LDETILVTEEEIYRAMQCLYYEDRIVAEGACVVGIAAMLAGKFTPSGPLATVITGRNLDMNLFTQIISGQNVQLGDYLIEGTSYVRP